AANSRPWLCACWGIGHSCALHLYRGSEFRDAIFHFLIRTETLPRGWIANSSWGTCTMTLEIRKASSAPSLRLLRRWWAFLRATACERAGVWSRRPVSCSWLEWLG